MNWWKKEGLREESIMGEIEKLKNSVKEVKRYKNKIILGLGNLEKWFSRGVNYAVYQKKKKKLSQLKSEYELYLYKIEKKIGILESIKKENQISKKK
jgi:hypothetical protein